MGSPRENGSGPVVDALGDPLVDLDRIPADRAYAQAQRLREQAFAHQVVDVGAFEAGFGFDFIKPQDAALACGQCRCLRQVTPERSVAFVGVTSIQ